MLNTVRTITDPDRIRNYLRDESSAFTGRADVVYLPAAEDELAQVLADATGFACSSSSARARTLVTVSGGGTSITGSRVPMGGGAVLSMERMTRVPDRSGAEEESASSDADSSRAHLRMRTPSLERLERGGFSVLVDREERRAIVPPAMPLSELDALLAPLGLFYPPDPTEMAATIGGTVATNAAGSRSFHYGPTRRWVRRLRVVLPDGDRVDLTRGAHRADGRTLLIPAEGDPRTVPLPAPGDYPMPACKNAAGLYLREGMDAIDLFIGSEGILGVVSEVEVALEPRPPETLTVIAFFAVVENALDFVDFAVANREAFPVLSLEFFDGRALEWMRPQYPDVPSNCGGAVLFETTYTVAPETGPYPASDVVERLNQVLERFHSVTDWAASTQEHESLRLFRHALPESVNAFGRAHQGKLGTDLAVPHEQFRRMYAIHEQVAGASGVDFVIYGHIGDAHLHLNFLPRDAEEAARARTAYVTLARRAVALGGTVSAEHGVGKKRMEVALGQSVPYLALLYGEAGLRAVAAVKRALDPAWILNVGNMVPPEAAQWT